MPFVPLEATVHARAMLSALGCNDRARAEFAITRSLGGPPLGPEAPLPGIRMIEPVSAPVGCARGRCPAPGERARPRCPRSPVEDPSVPSREGPSPARAHSSGRTDRRSRTRSALARNWYSAVAWLSCHCLYERALFASKPLAIDASPSNRVYRGVVSRPSEGAQRRHTGRSYERNRYEMRAPRSR